MRIGKSVEGQIVRYIRHQMIHVVRIGTSPFLNEETRRRLRFDGELQPITSYWVRVANSIEECFENWQ